MSNSHKRNIAAKAGTPGEGRGAARAFAQPQTLYRRQ
jgi:hypothetical protein